MLSFRGALALALLALSLASSTDAGSLRPDMTGSSNFAKKVGSSRPVYGPPLRPYVVQPLPHKLETSIDTVVQAGGPLKLKVSTFQGLDTILTCSWTSPEGITYVVDKDKASVDGKVAFIFICASNLLSIVKKTTNIVHRILLYPRNVTPETNNHSNT